MNSKEFLRELMAKTDLTIHKLSERTGVSEKAITMFLEKDGKLEIEEYLKIGKYFGISLDGMATGKPTDDDRLVIEHHLKPDQAELDDRFIENCEKLIIKAGLKSRLNELLPERPKLVEIEGKKYLLGFSGGIFHCGNSNDRLPNKEPKIDIKKVLGFDDFELYDKIKTFAKVDDLVPNLEMSDVIKLTDIRFFDVVNINNKKHSALYEISEDNKNYWKIIDKLLSRGAFLIKGNLQVDAWDSQKEKIIDYPATQMLRYIVKQNLK